MTIPISSSTRPLLEPAQSRAPAAECRADADFTERLARLRAHNERGLKYPDCTYALLERTQGDFLLLQSMYASALSAKLGTKPPSLEELTDVMPTISEMTKLGKTIAQLEKLIQPYRRELHKERSCDKHDEAVQRGESEV